jgi:hypothetical protein
MDEQRDRNDDRNQESSTPQKTDWNDRDTSSVGSSADNDGGTSGDYTSGGQGSGSGGQGSGGQGSGAGGQGSDYSGGRAGDYTGGQGASSSQYGAGVGSDTTDRMEKMNQDEGDDMGAGRDQTGKRYMGGEGGQSSQEQAENNPGG